MLMRALGHADPTAWEGASAEEAVPFPVAIHRRFALFVGTIDGIRILRALPLNKLRKSPPPQTVFANRECKIPRVDHDFHVNKIPITAVAEGRGAQDMVALAPRRRIG
jgi:hypothetical protein